ncbi:MAG: hypothetical protein Q4P66_02235 [Actinomycetaceae bacterium]|nr:hypothetical protein [Actinomycetaceae bacterium]
MMGVMLPKWFIEGRAEYKEWERISVAHAKAVRKRKAQQKRTHKRGQKMTKNTETAGTSAYSFKKITTSDIAISYPNMLCELDSSGTSADCILAACELNEDIFRPNIVFTSRNSDDALVDCVWHEQEVFTEQYPNSCLLMMSPYMRPNEKDNNLDYIGFLSTSSYSVDDQAVIVKRWDFSTGKKHLCATASFLPSQMYLAESTFTWIIDNLNFLIPQATLTAAAQKKSHIDTQIDSPASQRLGFPVLNQLYFPRPTLQKADYYTADNMGSRLKYLGADISGPHLLDIVLTTCGMQGNYQIVRGATGPVVIRTAPSTIDDAISYHNGYPDYAAYPCAIELILNDVLAWLNALPNYTFQDEIIVPEHELEQQIMQTNPHQAWKRFEFYTDNTVRNWIAIPQKDAFYEEAPPDSHGEIKLSAIPHFYVINTIAKAIGKSVSVVAQDK